MFKKVLVALGLLAVTAVPASAQLGLNYTTFVPGQTISAAQMTENFTNINNKALNRTGGTATGSIAFDSGAEFNGSFTIGSSDIQPFDSTGKIKEISTSYFASVSGANLTGIPETAISDGLVFPRRTADEIIEGTWDFDSDLTLSSATPILNFFEESGGTNAKRWRLVGSSGNFSVQSVNDAYTSAVNALVFTRSGTTVTGATLTATNITLSGAVSASSSLAVTTNMSVGGDASVTGDLYIGDAIAASSLSVVYLKGTGGTNVLQLDSTLEQAGFATSSGRWVGDFVPSQNGFYQLGLTGSRWASAWVTAGVLNSSDARLKKNITPTKLGIEFITALKPVEFEWKNTKFKGKYYGFIAQDLQQLGFAGVDASDPDELSVRYTDLIAPMVKAIQELHQELHILEAQNKLLRERMLLLEKGRPVED